jgi:glycosyltransferase involved in cell wall biosynthesis
MERNPTVSVVIPSHNMGDILPDAIESVLKQTYKDYEIIVIDDGSEDSTREIVEKYCGMGVRYYYQKNSGVAAARNSGIQRSKGYFVAFLDADDLWMPKKLELQMKAIQELNVGAMGCGYSFVDCTSGHHYSEIVRKNFPNRETLYKNLCISQIIPACSSGILIKKDYFRVVGYFNEALMIAEDWELWLRIAKTYDIKFVEQPLVLLRVNHGKPSYRVPSNEELFVGKVIREQVPKKYQSKAFAALYARLGRSCLASLDKKRGVGYLIRSIFLHPFPIYPRDQENVYKFPQIWRYYLLLKSFTPDVLIKAIRSWYLFRHK